MAWPVSNRSPECHTRCADSRLVAASIRSASVSSNYAHEFVSRRGHEEADQRRDQHHERDARLREFDPIGEARHAGAPRQAQFGGRGTGFPERRGLHTRAACGAARSTEARRRVSIKAPPGTSRVNRR